MKAIRFISAWVMLFLSVALMTRPASAQSIQPSATSIEEQYAIGIKALDEQNWPRAIIAFEAVIKTNRNYLDARAKLKKARRNLELKSLEAVLADYYAEGVAAMERNDLQAAFPALNKVYKINPAYRDVASRIARLKESLIDKTEAPPSSSARLDSMYQAALTLMARENWREAALLLTTIDSLHANYRYVNDLLFTAKANLIIAKAASSTQNSASTKPSFDARPFFPLLIVLPVIGFVALSPTLRARYYCLRGKYLKAAAIYERLLARHPKRLKLYTALGNIYLLQGRQDETALKVFETIVQHKLTTPNSMAIDSIVSQHYLATGKTDLQAFDVLEKSLQMKRQQQSFHK